MDSKGRALGNRTVSNLFYTVGYQIFSIIVPLITSPYIARVLGAELTGTYAYTYSVAQYFIIFAALGINLYGSRSIAKVSHNAEQRSKLFCSILTLHIFFALLSLVVYIVVFCIPQSGYRSLFLVQTAFIVGELLNITWYFSGVERFKVLTLRTTLIKVATTICIFTMVKGKDDFITYAVILAVGSLLGYLVIWGMLKNEVHFSAPSFQSVRSHLKPMLVLFIPVLAISVFTIMDKIMLGTISTMDQLSFYDHAGKMIDIPKGIIRATGVVMMPRTANLLGQNKEEKSKWLFRITLILVMLTGCGFAFGLASIGPMLAAVYWGEEFRDAGLLISLLSPALLFSIWGNVIRTQHLIPRGMDKDYVLSIVLSAIINFGMNMLLIPRLGSAGACIGTLAAELVLVVYQTIVVWNRLPIKEILRKVFPFFLFGFLMMVAVYGYCRIVDASVANLLIAIAIGVAAYALPVCLYVKNDATLKPLLKSILNRRKS